MKIKSNTELFSYLGEINWLKNHIKKIPLEEPIELWSFTKRKDKIIDEIKEYRDFLIQSKNETYQFLNLELIKTIDYQLLCINNHIDE